MFRSYKIIKIPNILDLNDVTAAKVFVNLNLFDLLNLQQVNIKLYKLVNNFRLTELIVKNDYEYKSISLNLFSRTYLSPVLINLKHLSIQDYASKEPFLNLSTICNHFIWLEVLEIEKFESRDRDDIIIQLNHLKKLKLTCFNSDFFIKAPRLTDLTLDYFGLNVIRFFNPLTIINLNIINYSHYCNNNEHDLKKLPGLKELNEFDDFKLLQYFRNLQTLELHLELDLILRKNLLSFYPYLKMLKLKNLYSIDHIQDNSMVTKMLNALIQSYNLVGRNIRLFCLNIELDLKKPIYMYNLSGKCEPSLELIVKYFASLTTPVDSVTELDFNKLLTFVHNPLPFHNPLPIQFFYKFSGVECVKVSNRPLSNQDYLLNFLKLLWTFKSSTKLALILFNTSLDKSFFNQLPKTCSLTRLDIVDSNERLDIDFKFLDKLKNLEHLRLNQSLMFKKICEWFRKKPVNNYFKLELIENRIVHTFVRFYDESLSKNRLRLVRNLRRVA